MSLLHVSKLACEQGWMHSCGPIEVSQN
jgi:hypothetical protein